MIVEPQRAARAGQGAQLGELLSARSSDQVRAALWELSKRFRRLRASAMVDASLARGQAGLALTHAALDRVFAGAGHAECAEQALQCAVDEIANRPSGPSLFLGFTGVAWVCELLAGNDRAGEDEDINSDIDVALEEILAAAPNTEPHDLVGGLVGTGVYALERIPRPSAARLLALVVERLARSAQHHAAGIAWWTQSRRGSAPGPVDADGHWDVGVAHGASGVVALLGRIVAAEVAPEIRACAGGLLAGAVAWLLAQELPAEFVGRFPASVGSARPRREARLSWCNGDLGIAAALLVAARGAREPRWEDAALRIALSAAARPARTSGVVDGGLCHGAAGNAHGFHRLFRMTGEDRFAEAARAWIAATLSLRVPGRGFAGFSAFSEDLAGRRRWWADPGLLTGAGGLALTLAAAVTHEMPWDRALLLS